MNSVNLNEYILDGLKEINSLIAHEVMVFFKNTPEKYIFQRLSNRSFTINLKNGLVEVSYGYSITQDIWIVQINRNKVFIIEQGRSKSVSRITEEIIGAVLS